MIPEKLKARLALLGIPETVYKMRIRKCILSRASLGESVPWCKQAYLMPEGGKSDSFVFDPVSLIPCLALEPENGDKILDMCAAPGSKTFIMSFLSNNQADITANDISFLRVRRLMANVKRHGVKAHVTNVSGRKISGSFNKILLDAPCSGEGMVNKHKKVFREWSMKRIKLMASKQKKLIKHAFKLLEPHGTLVYSTCTFAPEENEAVIDFLLAKNKDARVVAANIGSVNFIPGMTSWDGKEFDKQVAKCMRIYPQHNNTAGFFVAKIMKD